MYVSSGRPCEMTAAESASRSLPQHAISGAGCSMWCPQAKALQHSAALLTVKCCVWSGMVPFLTQISVLSFFVNCVGKLSFSARFFNAWMSILLPAAAADVCTQMGMREREREAE